MGGRPQTRSLYFYCEQFPHRAIIHPPTHTHSVSSSHSQPFFLAVPLFLSCYTLLLLTLAFTFYQSWPASEHKPSQLANLVEGAVSKRKKFFGFLSRKPASREFTAPSPRTALKCLIEGGGVSGGKGGPQERGSQV